MRSRFEFTAHLKLIQPLLGAAAGMYPNVEMGVIVGNDACSHAWKVWDSDACMLAEKVSHYFHLNVWWIVETSMHSPWHSV